MINHFNKWVDVGNAADRQTNFSNSISAIKILHPNFLSQWLAWIQLWKLLVVFFK